MISSKIICDSISAEGHRLTTILNRYPKMIHGEFMTHRAFSRNASSSRAVPVSKNIEEVRSGDLRAAPVFWGAEQKGMSPGEELSDIGEWEGAVHKLSPRDLAKNIWGNAAILAAQSAESLVRLGAHKSIVNRVLEPFLHINVVCTATEYANFFGLRLDKAADPTMRALAEVMWRAYNESTPRLLKPDEWHLPFIEQQDEDFAGEAQSFFDQVLPFFPNAEKVDKLEVLRRVSTSRCARLSYTSFETGKRSTIAEDLNLYDRLVGSQPLHASPAEHQATPDELAGPFTLTFPAELTDEQKTKRELPMSMTAYWAHPEQHGNFIGWRQYRKMLPGESCAPLPAGYHGR